MSSGTKPVGTSSPDRNASGFLQEAVDPLRYDWKLTTDPYEVPGIVATMIPTGARVLDVGCGTGSLSELIAQACGAEIVGVEPDAGRAQYAAERGLKVYTGYLNEELVREVGLFDAVLLADVLEHLPNPHEVLLLARSALKPGGAVIVSVPNVAHWSVRLGLMLGKFQYQPWGIMDATHLRWFTRKSIEALVVSAGFGVVAYRATAGTGLLDNYGHAPLRWLPTKSRERVLHRGSRQWPTLFGAQHVVKAQIA